jgi:hypothetical protein
VLCYEGSLDGTIMDSMHLVPLQGDEMEGNGVMAHCVNTVHCTVLYCTVLFSTVEEKYSYALSLPFYSLPASTYDCQSLLITLTLDRDSRPRTLPWNQLSSPLDSLCSTVWCTVQCMRSIDRYFIVDMR